MVQSLRFRVKRKSEIVPISENEPVSPGYHHMAVQAPSFARFCNPGQFCLLRIPGVFLRRPLSIYRVDREKVEFLYKVSGAGTRILSGMKAGEPIDILGPLGKGYDVSMAQSRTPVLVAGGIGIASLNFLAERLRKPGILLYGAQGKHDLLGLDTFRKRKWRIHFSTIDGTRGLRGLVTKLCENELDEKVCRSAALFACGPNAMLKNVAAIALHKKVPGFVCLEEKMACGVGICQGCAVRTKNGYKKVCSDGPVFDIRDIDWDELR